MSSSTTATAAAPQAATAKLIQPPEKYPEILSDLLTTLAEELHKAGLDVTTSNQISWGATECIRDKWGGQHIYINQGVSFETMARYRVIWDQFTGDNVAELARLHDISEPQLYKIIRIMRAEQQARTQGQLDLGEPA